MWSTLNAISLTTCRLRLVVNRGISVGISVGLVSLTAACDRETEPEAESRKTESEELESESFFWSASEYGDFIDATPVGTVTDADDVIKSELPTETEIEEPTDSATPESTEWTEPQESTESTQESEVTEEVSFDEAWPDSMSTLCAGTLGPGLCPESSDELFGQDGNYEVNVPSLKEIDDRAWDSVTGLWWTTDLVFGGGNYKSSREACADLDWGDETDWRLPSRLELISLLDFGTAPFQSIPAPIGPRLTMWTSTKYPFSDDVHWTVDGASGEVGTGSDITGFHLPLCVRGEELELEFEESEDVVKERLTDLKWLTGDLDDEFTWGEALEYCEDLDDAGHEDWRLPNIKEAMTLVNDDAEEPPFLDLELFDTDDATQAWWTSTPTITAGSAWEFDPFAGTNAARPMTTKLLARCVRER